MEEWKNPVLERQRVWMEIEWKEKILNSIEGKYKVFFSISALTANNDRSIPKDVWFDFVDGIFFLILLNHGGNFSFSKIESLTKRGFEEVLKLYQDPKIQRSIIDQYQFRSDSINLGKGIHTTLDKESLFRFNQLAKEFVFGKDSMMDLRKKFIEWSKRDYGLSESRNTKARPVIESLDQIFHNPDFCYGILMNTEPPVISENFSYLLGEKKKFKVAAWYQVLNERGWVKSPPSPKELINLLNEKMEGLDFGKDGRSLRGKDKSYGFGDFLKEMRVKIPKYNLH